jgi:hypothetical protein
MKSVVNEKLVKRNSRIGQITSLAALGILAVGLIITFKYPDKFVYSLGALLIGFILSQVGIYYGNRWGRSPRPYEIINKSLKGLGREYTIYHYLTPASHLLVGPAGVWTILPFYQKGTVTYEKERWRAKGGGFLQGYMRIFGQENIGRPDLEAGAEMSAVKAFFEKKLPEGIEVPEIKAALLFAHPQVEIHAEDAPLPALTPKDLKEFMRSKSKEKPIGPLTLAEVEKILPQPDQQEE